MRQTKSYKAIHKWLNENYSKPDKCQICGKVKKLDWANWLNKYDRDIGHYKALCRSCHFRFDKINWKHEWVYCQKCGKPITIKPSLKKERNYCSNACYFESKKINCKGKNNPNYKHGRYVYA